MSQAELLVVSVGILKHHRLIRGLLLCLVAAALILLRIREQTNYGQLHVRVSSESAPAVASVLAVGPGGSLSKLNRREDDEAIFSQLGTTSPVARIQLVTRPGVNVQVIVEEIRIGENWCTPSWPLAIVAGPTPVPLPAELLQSEKQPTITEYLPARFSSLSFLDRHGAINWQGDFWLLATPCLEAWLIVFVPWYLYCFLRPVVAVGLASMAHEPSMNPVSIVRRLLVGVNRIVVYTVTSLVAILVIHQLYWQIPEFERIRWGDQLLISVIVFAFLTWAVLRYCCWIVQLPGDGERLKAAGFLLLAVSLVKLFWIFSIDSVQTGDYQKYLEYGEQMAAGDWASFADREHSGFLIFLRRAFVWSYPLSAGFAHVGWIHEVASVFLQLSGALMFGWIVSQMFSVSVACCSIPFYFLYPGFWYAPTIVSHNTPGYFWMLASWCCLQKLRHSAACFNSAGRTWLKLVVCLTWIVALGICLGLMELTKSLNQVLLAGLLLMFAAEILRWQPAGKQLFKTAFRPTGLLFAGGICGSLLISDRLVELVDQRILARVAPLTLPSTSFADHVLGVDSDTDGSAIWVNWWKRDYYPLLTGASKSELAVRKLLHEKLTCGIQVFSGVLRRNHFYSQQSMDYAWRAFGARADSAEGAQEIYRVPWCGMQRRLIQGMCFVLLFFTVTRILLCPMFPVTGAELFPLCFSVGGYLGILLLAESAPYYGEIAVFPMIWCAGLIVERCCHFRIAVVSADE